MCMCKAIYSFSKQSGAPAHWPYAFCCRVDFACVTFQATVDVEEHRQQLGVEPGLTLTAQKSFDSSLKALVFHLG